MEKYTVKLTLEERAELEALTRSSKAASGRVQHARILLKSDDGLVDTEIAEALSVGVSQVERVRRRCVEQGIEASLSRKARTTPSRPRKMDGASEARLLQIACTEPPVGRTRWTLELLSERLVELKVFDSVSKSTVQRAMEKKRAEAVERGTVLHFG